MLKDVAKIDWREWKPTEEAVLCFLLAEEKVLLIHKKTGLGAGKINGPGGRLEPGETPREAAVRELIEEVDVEPLNPSKHGELSFIFTDGYSLHGTVFTATEFRGVPKESLEADPFWCPLSEIPYDRMWEDDPLWLPYLLAGSFTRGFFVFDDDKMLSKRVFIEDTPEVFTDPFLP
jgi:8-oxo-dGTP diphosphatase